MLGDRFSLSLEKAISTVVIGQIPGAHPEESFLVSWFDSKVRERVGMQ
jgi:hypothetical protein